MELSYHVLSREGTLSLARWAMSETDKVFAGSIPEIYDAFLVPLIFEGFADDLARRVASGSPRAVLESAAGSGVLTRALAGRIPPNAQYVATDLNQPILDQASRRQDSEEWITWQQANALSLPFPDHAFDAVCCQFGVMFFPIALPPTARRIGFWHPAGGLPSTSGTVLRRTFSPMTSPKPSRKSFPTIRPCSSRARRMGIMTSRSSGMNSSRPASGTS